uniref:Uncharacterized protein LOC110222319 isoform X1 n=1 Tax=Phascolarctos cinereus TaxID=38626 RepID=A0A6P5LZY4_PHACI|nr:uncharacterized protein LOC110222319 isoform X1 [Phascolarctos cinereus]
MKLTSCPGTEAESRSTHGNPENQLDQSRGAEGGRGGGGVCLSRRRGPSEPRPQRWTIGIQSREAAECARGATKPTTHPTAGSSRSGERGYTAPLPLPPRPSLGQLPQPQPQPQPPPGLLSRPRLPRPSPAPPPPPPPGSRVLGERGRGQARGPAPAPGRQSARPGSPSPPPPHPLPSPRARGFPPVPRSRSPGPLWRRRRLRDCGRGARQSAEGERRTPPPRVTPGPRPAALHSLDTDPRGGEEGGGGGRDRAGAEAGGSAASPAEAGGEQAATAPPDQDGGEGSARGGGGGGEEGGAAAGSGLQPALTPTARPGGAAGGRREPVSSRGRRDGPMARLGLWGGERNERSWGGGQAERGVGEGPPAAGSREKCTEVEPLSVSGPPPPAAPPPGPRVAPRGADKWFDRFLVLCLFLTGNLELKNFPALTESKDALKSTGSYCSIPQSLSQHECKAD